jgi:pimeloyl-ACP methyl ester carboxylesterase
MAEYDQPALWKYVMNITGVDKIIYIGHSQGTT